MLASHSPFLLKSHPSAYKKKQEKIAKEEFYPTNYENLEMNLKSCKTLKLTHFIHLINHFI